MHLKSFEQEISPEILQRGKRYFREECVTDLQGIDEGEWVAVVEGKTGKIAYK